jgi:hypothetical protein
MVEEGDKTLLHVLYTFLSRPGKRSYVRISMYMAILSSKGTLFGTPFVSDLPRCRDGTTSLQGVYRAVAKSGIK